jgi:hypothetical protein
VKLRQDLAAIAILTIVLTGSFLFILQIHPWDSRTERTRPFTAAIIDEVAATSPDPYLVANVTTALTRVGYKVDYYGPKEITIDFFRSLPSKGYGMIILRDHSTSLTGDVIALVTSEPFDAGKYSDEKLAGQVTHVSIAGADPDYFGITPTFVRESMQGTFPNAVLVVMGCAGLTNSEMAQAFVSRGVQVYVSWNQIVLVNRSDGGTILFVQSMIGGHRVDSATTWATENAPPSQYSSQLEYYPLDQAGLVLN